jgi:hypothetical protein
VGGEAFVPAFDQNPVRPFIRQPHRELPTAIRLHHLQMFPQRPIAVDEQDVVMFVVDVPRTPAELCGC